ncbi:unnamed protein product [Linum tenue]|uniref:DELLA protein RGL1 n=1 Tax=Linum tenue TaxID=586396 RepID=A0AAV0M896_9ROSI|nr:unnamed protein product [Linum tenue]
MADQLEFHHEEVKAEEEEEEESKKFNYEEEEEQVFNSRAWFDILKHRLSSSSAAAAKTPESAAAVGSRKLWTNEIIKLAGARIIQSRSSTDGIDVPAMLGDGGGGLNQEEAKDVELMEHLLECAEKVGKGEFDRAIELLGRCNCWASQTGNPVQRLAYYFGNALRQRMKEGTEEVGAEAEQNDDDRKPLESDTAVTLPDEHGVEFHRSVPFYTASQLAAVQIMMDNVVGEKRIHVIELRICSGLPMIALMQALTSSGPTNSIEMLRITALANDESEERFIHGSGERLVGFAREMGLPFSFKIVRIWDSPAAHKDKLGLEPREATVVLAEYALSRMVTKPNRLEAMMKLIRSIRPRVMVVIETEANHNAPDFGHRFVETLFTAGAYFDCLASCMEGNEAARAVMESRYLNDRIRNILVAEGEKRVARDVKIGVWRKYFARFGMLEISVRGLGLQHANLVIRSSPFAGSCLVALDRKSLMIGWKDMPLLFVSAWKFMKAIPH